MSELADRDCVPCSGDTPPLKGAELEELGREVPEWSIVDEHHLSRKWSFKNFKQALEFVQNAGELAEEQSHHPDFGFGWGWAELVIFTHSIDGLTESDFVLAAKLDLLTD